MSRLNELFGRKASEILNVYCTAGFPQLDSTADVMTSLQKSGADLLEIGMPYSDPVADGPVIQASSQIALQNGMTIAVLFAQLKLVKNEISIPVILMGYLNPILQFGFEKFCAEAAASGVDGLIIPDLPLFEYRKFYKETVMSFGLDMIFLVTPETSEERIRELDTESSGFLYAVSSSSLTGSEMNFDVVEKYLLRLKKMDLKNPVLVGFGISTKDDFKRACAVAHGAIIGSAYIRALSGGADIRTATKEFVEGILK
jgi:tryptophan synthase alpha chain